MANPDHLAQLHRGKECWNQWRQDNPDVKPDFREASLEGLDLHGFDFRSADFSEAKIVRTYAMESDFRGALFRSVGCGHVTLTASAFLDADFTDAYLEGPNFAHASLAGARLAGVNALWANFHMTDLDDTDFLDASLSWCVFANTDLSSCKNLESVQFGAPCNIDVDTLYRAKGTVPSRFLRGCGLPDIWISRFTSHPVRPTGDRGCIFAYEDTDAEFVEQLTTDLSEMGTAVCSEGESRQRHFWVEACGRVHPFLVVVCSRASLNSASVVSAIDEALIVEDAHGQQTIVPLVLDNFVFSDWAHQRKDDILGRVLIDFSEWDLSESKYLDSLSRLCRTMRAGVSFDEYIEQGESLIGLGYFGAAASVLGGALEVALRTAAATRDLLIGDSKPGLGRLNQALYAAGLYDSDLKKRIAHHIIVRNRAAHGYYEGVSARDVGHMLRFLVELWERFCGPSESKPMLTAGRNALGSSYGEMSELFNNTRFQRGPRGPNRRYR